MVAPDRRLLGPQPQSLSLNFTKIEFTSFSLGASNPSSAVAFRTGEGEPFMAGVGVPGPTRAAPQGLLSSPMGMRAMAQGQLSATGEVADTRVGSVGLVRATVQAGDAGPRGIIAILIGL